MEILMNMNKEGEKNLCNVQERAQTLESELNSNSATCLISCVTLRELLSEILRFSHLQMQRVPLAHGFVVMIKLDNMSCLYDNVCTI